MRDVSLPRSLEELWGLLDRESAAALYAGGTDLLVKLRAGLEDPPALICLERVGELKGVQDELDEVWIGAATTLSTLMEDPIIQRRFQVLRKGLEVLGSPPVRHMGTIGGNIVTASPAGDTLPALYVLGAQLEIRSKDGSRVVAIRDFIVGPGQVLLNRGEILAGIRLRKVQSYAIHHYEKVGRRKSQACAIASMAALLTVSDSGVVEAARLAWGSVGPTVVICREAEAAIEGKPLSMESLKLAIPLVEKAVSPIDDIRADAAYRRTVAGLLLLRLSEYSAGTCSAQ